MFVVVKLVVLSSWSNASFHCCKGQRTEY